MSCRFPAVLICLAVASSAQAETIAIDVWPSTKTLSLSASAVIRSLPPQGARVKSAFRHFGRNALSYRYESPLVYADGDNNLAITFYAPSVSRSVDDLIKQYSSLRGSIDQTFNDFSGRSHKIIPDTAELDQSSPAVFPPGAEDKIEQARLTILSVLWDDGFLQLGSGPIEASAKETARPLEEVISGNLSLQRINLAVAFTGLDQSEVSAAAPHLLAEEIRRRKIGLVPTIQDPSLPTRSYRINDPNFLNMSYQWRGNIAQLKTYLTDYCLSSVSYWQSVVDKEILNGDDVAALKNWHFLDSKFAKTPADTPAAYVKTLCDKAEADLLHRQADSELRAEIARLTASYWMCGSDLNCERFAQLPAEQKGNAIALEAAKAIGADEKVALSHSTDYDHMLPLVIKYFEPLLRTNVAQVLAGSVDAITLQGQLSIIIGDFIASEIESTWIATTLDIGPLIEVGPYIFSPWQTQRTYRPITEISGILREMLQRPVELDQYLARLQEWRTRNADATAIPAGVDFTSERVWRKASIEWERFNTARRDNDRAKDVAQTIFALNGALGFSDLLQHQNGRVLLPDDSIVEALHVVAGEQVEAAQPVVTVADLFSRHGRAFIDAARLSTLNLIAGHAFVVSDAGATEKTPPDIKLLMIVRSAEPQWTGKFEVNFDLIRGFDTKAIMDRPKTLPEFIRVQWRFCRAGVEVYAGATCEAAEKLLPRVGPIELNIVREITQ